MNSRRGDFVKVETESELEKGEDGKSGHRIVIIKDIIYVIGNHIK